MAAQTDYWKWYQIRMLLLKRDRLCVYCGKELDKFTVTIDHIIPRSRGGGSNMTNMCASCRNCNNDKGSMLPLEFIQKKVENQLAL